MDLDRINEEIGDCSIIIYHALKLNNSSLRNKILKHTSEYRQELREVAYELEKEQNNLKL